MESENWEKILLKIEEIKNGTEDLKQILSKLSILPREQLIENIYSDIIVKHHPIFKEREIRSQKKTAKKDDEIRSDKDFVNSIIINLKNNPAKKVLYLKQFLDNLSEISESDRKVVLKSLEGTDIDDLEEKMHSLIEIFKIDLNR